MSTTKKTETFDIKTGNRSKDVQNNGVQENEAAVFQLQPARSLSLTTVAQRDRMKVSLILIYCVISIK